MLKQVKIENFRCLKNVEVELSPLTVLIGPNDSGKSAFLAGLQLLSSGRQLTREDSWRCQTDLEVIVRAQGSGITVFFSKDTRKRYRRELEPPGVDPSKDPTLPLGYFQLPSSGVSMRSVGHSDAGTPPGLGTDGSQIATLVDYLLRRDRRRFDEFVDAMRERVPGLQDVQIATPDPKMRRIDLVIDNGLVLPADNASVGVRLLLFFLALSFHPSPANLILLEEPETGLHPGRLADVMRLLHEISRGTRCGHPAQIVLTTHSPYLLDHVDLDQDQVLVFRRNDDGSRTAEPVDAERMKTFLDDFMLGEVWFNEQEEGLIKRGD